MCKQGDLTMHNVGQGESEGGSQARFSVAAKAHDEVLLQAERAKSRLARIRSVAGGSWQLWAEDM